MDLSGIIFVLLAAVWAVFLIPKALRHSDEAARTRSLDRFSSATRVLARREPVTGRDARLVVTPPARPVVGAAAPEPATRARVAARRTAARAAARRRRRILAFLLLCTLGVVAAAASGRLPWHWMAVPAGVTLAFLVLCRVLVRRSRRPVAHSRPTHAPAEPGPQAEPVTAEEAVADGADPVDLPAVDVPPADKSPVDGQGVAQFDDAEDTMGLSVAALQAALDSPPLPEPGAGTLWDPLPVTLPTYVTKPKARRTVRTIDLGEPGTWTSGRTVEDAEIAARATQAPDGESGSEGSQHAVGS